MVVFDVLRCCCFAVALNLWVCVCIFFVVGVVAVLLILLFLVRIYTLFSIRMCFTFDLVVFALGCMYLDCSTPLCWFGFGFWFCFRLGVVSNCACFGLFD